ncbi:MAG: hypothetical protein M0C28_30170 [Candidatus Moduliflexus flocculans]|nr:hypothetical protein [Candidatus Moduliflexus flocculans]
MREQLYEALKGLILDNTYKPRDGPDHRPPRGGVRSQRHPGPRSPCEARGRRFRRTDAQPRGPGHGHPGGRRAPYLGDAASSRTYAARGARSSRILRRSAGWSPISAASRVPGGQRTLHVHGPPAP